MQYLLDTNICIFFLRGMLKFDEIIRQKGLDNCFISELTVFELKYGAENSTNPKKSHQAVDKFVKGLTVIPIYLWNSKSICRNQSLFKKKRYTFTR
ncbi:MAG: hypothetical protein VB074_12420 [Proteiniphilum sp.]|jgi:tRNA(fMet)-specific endonuclease VapC|uniref:hypothetical protein n=1 Tax=Proteiniphilum sp. TaxID=1926877 RepID=UPI002B211F70|nr:hypothetical protein [Proteiniphilum sp.]MEA5128983.1 hypothetical protein [Proteiniphilum sp.]